MTAKLLPARMIEFVTPKKIILSGLFFGPWRPKTVYIFIHGLAGSLFSRHEISTRLLDRKSGVLIFNNRGSGLVNNLKKLKKGRGSYGYDLAGQAHEIFEDCVDDLDGAVRQARLLGAKNIFLVGHSTGCQKSIYYLSRRPTSPVIGVVLLAPVSDYASIVPYIGLKEYRRFLAVAKRWLRAGKGQDLLTAVGWSRPLSAQRFLSLYDPESAEEIFTYASNRQPLTLRKVKKPLLLLLAADDKFHDRPAADIAAWFRLALKDRQAEIKIIKNVGHNFLPRQHLVSNLIKNWSRKIS